MKSMLSRASMLMAALLTFGLSAQAGTVSVTFVGAPTGVNDGTDYVLPYELDVNGILTVATCYDIFDSVIDGQSWTANALTLNEAAAIGQFSSDANALERYMEVGFLFEQTTDSPQNQIDLQHDIWNIFGGDTYAVTAGMQSYLNLLNTSAYTDFNFNTVEFLEDVNQTTGRAQAFVIDPPAEAPEPGTIMLMGAGAVLIGIGKMKRQKRDWSNRAGQPGRS